MSQERVCKPACCKELKTRHDSVVSDGNVELMFAGDDGLVVGYPMYRDYSPMNLRHCRCGAYVSPLKLTRVKLCHTDTQSISLKSSHGRSKWMKNILFPALYTNLNCNAYYFVW